MVGGLEHFLYSPIVEMMIQSDYIIFFRGVGIPPIRYIYIYIWVNYNDLTATEP